MRCQGVARRSRAQPQNHAAKDAPSHRSAGFDSLASGRAEESCKETMRPQSPLPSWSQEMMDLMTPPFEDLRALSAACAIIALCPTTRCLEESSCYCFGRLAVDTFIRPSRLKLCQQLGITQSPLQSTV